MVRLGGSGSGSDSDAIAVNANVNQLQVCRCSTRSEDKIDYLTCPCCPTFVLGESSSEDFRDSDPSAASAGKSMYLRLAPDPKEKEPERAIISKPGRFNAFEIEYIRCNWFSKSRLTYGGAIKVLMHLIS